ncbi:MAG: hypothetical protein ACYTGG_07865 [Planctomycetota bacterium]|jgi:uncharacterized membrane protein YkoI
MNRRSNIVLILAAIAVVGLAGLAAAGHADDVVTLDEVPPAARATILAQAAGGEILEIEVEEEDGMLVYEAEIAARGRVFEIEVAADGSLLSHDEEDDDDTDDDDDEEEEEEEEVSLDEIPAAAADALLALAGDHVIEFVELDAAGDVALFEAAWVVGDFVHEATVLADGTLVQLQQVVGPDSVPPAVLRAAEANLPPDAAVSFEMKMVIVYEVEAGDGEDAQELHILPTGRILENH